MAKAGSNSKKNDNQTESNENLPIGIRRYDFRIARKLSQQQRIWFGRLHSQLAANLTKAFEELFQCETIINFIGLEQMQGSNFKEKDLSKVISADSALHPGSGHLYFIWPREMAFFFIEKLLGGTGDALFTEKELSGFEKGILKKVADTTFKSLQQAIEGRKRPRGDCEKIIEGAESFSDILPYEILLIGTVFVRVNGQQGNLTIIYPYSVVKSWVEDREADAEGTVPAKEEALPADGVTLGLAKAPVRICVRMNTNKIKVIDFINLQEGDCLVLNHSISEPLDVYIDSKLKYKGYFGLRGGQIAVQLITPAYQQKPPAPTT